MIVVVVDSAPSHAQLLLLRMLIQKGRRIVVPRSLGFFLADALLDEVLCCADGVGRAANRYPTISSSGRINALLRYLYVCSAKVLNLQQGFATWAQDRPDNMLPDLQLRPENRNTKKKVQIQIMRLNLKYSIQQTISKVIQRIQCYASSTDSNGTEEK